MKNHLFLFLPLLLLNSSAPLLAAGPPPATAPAQPVPVSSQAAAQLLVRIWPLVHTAMPRHTLTADEYSFTVSAPKEADDGPVKADEQFTLKVRISPAIMGGFPRQPHATDNPDVTVSETCYDLRLAQPLAVLKPITTADTAPSVDRIKQRWAYTTLLEVWKRKVTGSYMDFSVLESGQLTRWNFAVWILRTCDPSLSRYSWAEQFGPANPTKTELLAPVGFQSWDTESVWLLPDLFLEFAPEIAAMVWQHEEPPKTPRPPACLPLAAWVSVSYGHKIDPKLVENINQAVADYAAENGRKAALTPISTPLLYHPNRPPHFPDRLPPVHFAPPQH